MRLEPTNIQQIGDELAIHWNDGTERNLDLNFSGRVSCAPAAASRRARNIMSRPGG